MICSKCSKTTEKYKSGKRCADCVAKWHAEHYQKPHVKDKHLDSGRKWRERNKHKQRQMDLKSRLKTRYNLSVEQYKAMLDGQEGVCAICKSDSPQRKNSLGFFVDHCHETGKIRGLLCHPCNLAVGWIDKNRKNIDKAKTYSIMHIDHK